jgi:hypothetical protein
MMGGIRGVSVRFLRRFIMRFPRRFVAVCAALTLVLTAGVTYALASPNVTRDKGGWYTCRHDLHADVNNDMIVRNNGGQPMCVGSSNWGDNFTVERSSVTRNWADFPNVYLGCELDGNLPQLCTSGHSTPIRVSTLRTDVSSVSYRMPSHFRGNSAYDIWFNKSGGQPKGRDNGAEVMVWLGTRGIGRPAYTRKVKIDGIWWGYDTWIAGRAGSTRWNYIRYWRLSNPGGNSSATLNLIPFFKDAERMKKLSSSWYLTGTEYGFEVCYAGRGLAVTNFTDNIVGPPLLLGGLKHGA